MHDEDRDVGELGETDNAVRGFVLGDLWARDGVEIGCGVSGRFQTVCNEGYHIAVLSVDHGGEAQGPSCHQDIEDLRISELHWFISHVELYACNALLYHEWHFGSHNLGCWIGEDQVEAVVAVALVFGSRVVFFDTWQDSIFSFLLRGEC